MKLRTELLFMIFVVIMLPLVILSLVWGHYAEQQAKQLFYQQDRLLIHQASEPLADLLKDLQSEVAILAATPVIRSLDWQRIQPLFKHLLQQRPYRFGKMFLGLRDGRFYATSLPGNPHQGGLITQNDTDPSAPPKLLTERHYWQYTVRDNRAAEPRVVISEPIYSYTTGSSQMVVAATVLSANGEVLGVVGGTFEWDDLKTQMDFLEQRLRGLLQDSSNVALMFRDGTFAYHWDKQGRAPTRPDQDLTAVTGDDGDSSLVLFHRLLQQGESNQWFDPSPESPWMLLQHPLHDSGYALVLMAEKETLQRPLQEFRQTTYLVFLVALMLTIPLAYVLTRRVFDPVQRLSLYTRATADGYNTLLVPSGKNEIGELEQQLQRMTRELAAREAKVKSVLDSATDAVISLDGEGRVIEWNLAAERLFGWPRAEMLGQTLQRIIPKTHYPQHCAGVHGASHKGHWVSPRAQELSALHASGKAVAVELTLSKWYSEDKPYFTGIVRDISDRKAQERLLEAISQRLEGKTGQDYLQQLVLSLADLYRAEYALVSRVNPDGSTVTTLAVAKRGQVIANFSYSLEGTPCETVLDSDDVCLIAADVGLQFPGDTLPNRLGASGYAAIAIRNAAGAAIGLLVVMDDKALTELQTKRSILKIYATRVGAELARVEYEQSLRLAAIAFETLEGITVTDARGNILRVNQAFTEITGYTEAEVIGKNPRILQSGLQDGGFYRRMWEALISKGYWQGEIWNRRKSGEIYPEWLCISAVRDSEGVTTNYIATFLDMQESKQQRLEIERRSAEEQVIGEILHCGLQPLNLKDFLNRSLDVLTQNTLWVQAEYQSSIFLLDEGQRDQLRLVAFSNNLGNAPHRCQRMAVGQCVCGLAAQTLQPQFTPYIDASPQGTPLAQSQGVYSIPIQEDGYLQGVLQVGVPAGNHHDPRQEEFLLRVANVLSLGISKRLSDGKLEYQAYHDALTGLGNRLMLEDRSAQAIQLCARRGEFLGLIFVDLDHFKNINDSLGHGAGDALLKQVSQRVSQCLRAEDTVTRVGGDEFVVLLPLIGSSEAQALEVASRVARKILQVMGEPFWVESRELQASCSLGVVIGAPGQCRFDHLLKQADIALYQAKTSGRSCIHFFELAMQERVDKRLELERRLRSALEEEQFYLCFQPQIDASAGQITAEALIRWRLPDGQVVSPLDFIPVAEETGLIIPIGEWVIRSACRFIKQLEQRFDLPVHIAVNVSARQFNDPSFVPNLQQMLAEHAVEPQRLGVELTESLLVDDIGRAIEIMNQLREMGISLSIDDFGTGYSALSYLKQLPIDILKIDRSFVREVHQDKSSAAIAEAILAMASNLGLKVVAEGVETDAELKFLQQRGCQVFQGFYFSKPLEQEQFTAYYQQKVVH